MLMWRMECPGNLFQLKERWESSLEKVLLLFILLKTEVQNITGVSTYNVTPMKLLFISIKSSSFALRSSVFFLESRLTCLFSST